MRLAVLGYGVVGQGVVQICDEDVPELDVVRILDLPERCSGERMTSSFDEIVGDESIEAVVECMGGLEPARSYILAALEAGKHVVTSNKAVVAANFQAFVDAADQAGVSLFIEATTGGGIPWIASIAKARRIDFVSEFSGIMNGTTNYIIDQMSRHGLDFSEALARAQELGYAERDPSADIDGIDVANKTIISCGVAFGVACRPDLPVAGIRNLTKADMDLLAERGLSVRLLGRGVCDGHGYAACVEPVALPARTLEACVPDNFNLVSLTGQTIGELKFYGQGAGGLPTGNAMVQDLIDCASGTRLRYDLSAGLSWDPTLISGTYLLRTTADIDGEGGLAPGTVLMCDVTSEQAHEALAQALKTDPEALLVALPEEF